MELNLQPTESHCCFKKYAEPPGNSFHPINIQWKHQVKSSLTDPKSQDPNYGRRVVNLGAHSNPDLFPRRHKDGPITPLYRYEGTTGGSLISESLVLDEGFFADNEQKVFVNCKTYCLRLE
ncbi:hypothetical protein K443DRAFT_670664 [Laccaria amethystina LaAM-08-1]|uniref:Uncharacterized protein n=1 Tax=Laccaria amethystina LaAM-08-1 TaxID=1095629 RepID=A0A0C9XYP8_9AGAR|nr:hypothetical protein K443DRAFT_670664 [Laccaria amethystina LaAM-08-1]